MVCDNPIWACFEEGAWECLEVVMSKSQAVLCTSKDDPIHRAAQCKYVKVC